MNNDDEKFFEALVEQKASADEEYKVELAKTASGVAQKPHVVHKEEKSAEREGDSEGQLTVDVYQTPAEIVIESAIAGVKPEDIDISVNSDSVTIKGARHRDKEVKEEDYFYQECYWGRFSRSVILPQEINPEEATVNFKNGILTVRLPKLDRKKSKKLKVKVE
ncbi:MAG: Hsp20/alpha crystallin family protein [Candidatus Liptonbacteria bacterium]|nr:Hsp20/alpha crystallin family protein [Candidatus Liptonbacteria bacterium]